MIFESFIMKIERILYPTDFSELGQAAEAAACEFAEQFQAELHVLHVMSDLLLMMPRSAASVLIAPKFLEDAIHSAEVEIQNVPDPARKLIQRIVRVVRSGTAFDTITQYAKDNAIDLIVIGTHGRTGLSHVLLGSVAEKVVQHAECSVLTVRHKSLAPTENSTK